MWSVIKFILYVIYIAIIFLAIPGVLYGIAIPVEYLVIPYWFSLSFILLTNVFIITEGIIIMVMMINRYYQKRRLQIWNRQTGQQHIMYESDVKSRSPLKHLVSDVVSQPKFQRLMNYTYNLDSDYPDLSVVIAAYLVNEREIIEDTLEHMAKLNYYKPIKVILVYNTPEFQGMNELLDRLERFKYKFESDWNKMLYVVKCENSHSKAENINYVLDLMAKEQLPKTDYIAIYDADHHPEPDSLTKAIDLLRKKKADILQGRCVILNNRHFISSLVAVEFNLIYILHHKGGEILRGFGFFGGSNGVWSYPALAKIRMDPTMLTEDIDSSFRAIEAGYKVIYSTDCISYELAPTNLGALIKQRLRWAQGWFQVTLRHTKRTLQCPYINVWNKIMFMYLLIYREIFFYVSSQVLPIFIIDLIRSGYKYQPYLLITTFMSLCILPIELIAVKVFIQLDVDHIHPNLYRELSGLHYIKFYLCAPIYDFLKFFIVVVSHLLELVGNKKWRVTARS